MAHSILIFEDDLDLARQWKSMLEAEGFDVDHVWSAQEVFYLCNKHQYDLVICDIFLKDSAGKFVPEGGITILSYFRSKELEKLPSWAQAVPIIVVSGAKQAQGYDPLYLTETLGATATLRKPFSPQILMNKISELLDYKPKLQSPGERT